MLVQCSAEWQILESEENIVFHHQSQLQMKNEKKDQSSDQLPSSNGWKTYQVVTFFACTRWRIITLLVKVKYFLAICVKAGQMHQNYVILKLNGVWSILPLHANTCDNAIRKKYSKLCVRRNSKMKYLRDSMKPSGK